MPPDTEFAHPPQRRIGALAFVRNRDGRVLVVEKTYRIGPERWGLVGGCAHADEDARAACAREAREETGLDVTPGAILAVHYMPAAADSAEGYNIIFDCGTVAGDAEITLPPGELSAYRWAHPADLSGIAPYTRERITQAFSALNAGGAPYLAGHPTNV